MLRRVATAMFSTLGSVTNLCILGRGLAVIMSFTLPQKLVVFIIGVRCAPNKTLSRIASLSCKKAEEPGRNESKSGGKGRKNCRDRAKGKGKRKGRMGREELGIAVSPEFGG